MEITGKVDIVKEKQSPAEKKEGAGLLLHSSRRGRHFNPSEAGDQEILTVLSLSLKCN